MNESRNVLALEPWYGGSHKAVLEGLSAHSRHAWHVLGLPARFWKWRMQGAAVTLARQTVALLDAGYRPDVLFASSMLNMPAFSALTKSRLHDVPIVLLMHESQLTYPQRAGQEPDLTYAFLNYLSCLVADRVVFNSEHHRREFLGALPDLLRRLPDQPHRDTVDEIWDRSCVRHLGIDCSRLDAAGGSAGSTRPPESPLAVVWNHRWEHDKNPESFFRVLRRLADAGNRFDLIVLGGARERQPSVFDDARRTHANRILRFGFEADAAQYAAWLRRGDVAVSTADHEFFGISMLEAIHCGCHPLLPRRLSYQELLREPPVGEPHAPIFYSTEDQLLVSLTSLLRGETRPLPGSVLRKLVAPYDWSERVQAFDQLIDEVEKSGPLR